eukprot:TRINITY_DN50164_c0_g1_i1.p1 TRINITY_DN50164_c0_g1~~TRINITY_DN50164_c0_g1_i1.p1  ORF type:complete len:614 (+),score=173.09 TRINITY_DN50164_c0_g1_i1:75-1916(+)
MATAGDAEMGHPGAPLVPNARGTAKRAAAPSIGAAGRSSHAHMIKSTSKSFTGVGRRDSKYELGAHVGIRSTSSASGASQLRTGAQGTVAGKFETDHGTMLLVAFDDGLVRVMPQHVLQAAGGGHVKSVQEPGPAGPAGAPAGDEDVEEWQAVEYEPGDPILKSLAMIVFGEQQWRKVNGREEHRRAWSWLNSLLIFVPLSFIANYGDMSASVTFIFSFLAIVPLAGLLGAFTEDLACHVGSALGALLNASFGNATEIIISIFAVQKKLFTVIKNSMLGSVMGNMLLVLGCAFIARSVPNGTEERRKEQQRSALWNFNAESANVFASLLLLAAFALAVPTAYAQLHVRRVAQELSPAEAATPEDIPRSHTDSPPSSRDIYDMSRATSIAMILGYIIFLFFQVRHNEVFNASDRDNGSEDGEGEGEGEEEEAPKMSKLMDMSGLLFITVLIGFVSEFLVSSLEDATEKLGLSEAWVAVILLPIIGNAAEHATAIVSAYKGDMEIAVGVAIGSSIQIAGFAVPVLVVVSWIVNGQNPKPLLEDSGKVKMCGSEPCPGALDLNFHPFSMTCMILSVIVVNTIVTDGKGTWLEGITLLITYCVIGIAFWYVPTDSDA